MRRADDEHRFSPSTPTARPSARPGTAVSNGLFNLKLSTTDSRAESEASANLSDDAAGRPLTDTASQLGTPFLALPDLRVLPVLLSHPPALHQGVGYYV